MGKADCPLLDTVGPTDSFGFAALRSPNNLLQAVTTAVTPSSIGRGTLVVLNDRIASALYVSKTHANTVDTFKAPEEGFVGMLLSDKAFYYYERSRPTFKEVYDVSGVQELPPVDIFYGYQGADLELLNASIAQGAKGIIVAGQQTNLPHLITAESS